ncbi:hypothetical protein JA1_003504 [Spathaspora sp. JA1]|nr:hypothetical protein JA1_003504 [Spathaspora sp. JA1]
MDLSGVQSQSFDLLFNSNKIILTENEIQLIEHYRANRVRVRPVPTIMILPDDVLLIILNHLNQIQICDIYTVHSRLYQLGKAKLYQCIYLNNYEDYPIQISSDMYSPFYRKFTIVNMGEDISWLNENSNIHLIKRIVFKSNGEAFDRVRIIYPWIDAMVEDEIALFGQSVTTQSKYSTDLMLSSWFKIPELDKSEKLPRVTKLTLYMARVNDSDLLKISSLCGSRELIVKFHIRSEFDMLLSLGLKNLPIRSLSISFSSIGATGLQIGKIEKVFNLRNLTTFELDCWFASAYIPDNGILALLLKMSNVKHLSIITKEFPYNDLSKVLKSNSLHTLYLKLQQGIDAIENEIGKFLATQRFSLRRLYKELFNDVRKIGNMFQGGSRFYQLHQVVFNDRCYLIERNGEDKIDVVPCN